MMDDYYREVGRAVYQFAGLERAVAWLGETIERGFNQKVPDNHWSAKAIGLEFQKLVEQLPRDDLDRADMLKLASEYRLLVSERDMLVHGNPHTAEDGTQRLGYNAHHGSRDWTIGAVREIGNKFESLSAMAGTILHRGRYQRWEAES
ncbi:hypothetical protein [Kaistia sp. MMO-174]|uniref:hypothetical protein n=1 Tax=Kaistia sp. MMO-174 TaxID=3081256 RepID=UPI00301B20A5